MVEYVKFGVWYYDVWLNMLEWDDIMYEFYGIDKRDFSGVYEVWEISLYLVDKESNVSVL